VRILVVSQYYPPEVGATQNRLASFVDGLSAAGHHVTVVCEQPNHPSGVFQAGFGRRPWVSETKGNVTVRRLWVAAAPRKTTFRRLGFYGTFAVGCFITCLLERHHDAVLATSPPLPGALAARAAAALTKTPFVLDVRDLWPAAAEALGELSSRRLIRRLEKAERWLYTGSEAITATTAPFCRHIDEVAGTGVSVHLPNGALDELIERTPSPPPSGAFTIGYVGNFGIAQGIGIVLDAADLLRGSNIRFTLTGDGPLRSDLLAQASHRGLDNVHFKDPVPVKEIGGALAGCNALLVPLRNHPLLDDFIPSKLYDAMAVGRPVIGAVRGEAAAIVRDHGCGLVVGPENGRELADAAERLARDSTLARELGERGRAAAAGFTRSRQAARLERVLRDAVATAGRRAA
jgi:glycosyltransferase involved in cell wall biosynthesis